MNESLSAAAGQTLKVVPFFANLTLDEAAALARRLPVRRYQADQVIFHLDDPGGLLYIIVAGKVKIARAAPDGQEALLAILGAGDFFGELALMDDAPRSATAVALEPTETLTLDRLEFKQFMDYHPTFADHVMRTLTRRLRHLNDQLSDMIFMDLPGRLARLLLHLADEHGRPAANGTMIELLLTQTDLAEMTGATRVSINKALGRFRRAGWVQTRGQQVTILNREGLERLIHYSGG